MINKDKLSLCPKCNCDACYVLPINETKNSYFCWGCGYRTNDLMKEGEFDIESYEETLPELYKNVKYIDSEKRLWYPITINIQNKGTVFLFGTSNDDITWAAIKAKALSEEEKLDPKFKGAEYKSDSKSLKYFQNDFIEALDYIEFFEIK